jgi:hypothetical protein
MFQPLIQAEETGESSLLSEALARFFASDRVVARTDDDLSLILATRRNTADPG